MKEVKSKHKSTSELLLPILFIILMLLVWEIYVRAAGVDQTVLPSPSRIVAALWYARSDLLNNTLYTLLETAIGLTISIIIGSFLAILIDISKLVDRTLYPVLVVSQTIPMVALAPLLVLWFGFGLAPKVIVVVLVTFFPIVVAMVDGLRSTDRELIKLLKTMGANRLQTLTKVQLPASLPYLFSGIKVGVTYGVIGAIFGEYVGAYQGLGILIQTAKNSFRTDLVFAAICVTAMLSIGLFWLTNLVERKLIPWHAKATS